MGLSDVPDDVLRSWVERTCADRGVPLGVTDAVTVRKVAALLGAAARPRELQQQCLGQTMHGRYKPCRRRTKHPSGYCWQHRPGGR